MKKFLLGTAALLALASQASAADMAARPYTKAPPMVAAIYDWTGFYIGANGGYGTSSRRFDFIDVTGVVTPNGRFDADGATAGGQIGYRWQAQNWVFGLEAQGNWADLRGSGLAAITPVVTNRSRIEAFGLFTGQIGYAWNNALLYAKGGAAVVDTRNETFFTVLGPNSAGSAASNSTRWGATVGGGIEFGFAPNWSAGVEYNHIFAERTTFGLGAGTAARVRGDVDLVTARINYRWGGPVVARY